ncbi:MAG: type II toxin-antitoxin system VapC family toxin [Vicinamibacterales bacterium]
MLVDTGAWYAIADASDRYHAQAREFYLAEAPRGRLVTTDLIVAESWALVSAHLGRAAALTFWETLRLTRTPTLTIDRVDLESAWHIVHAFADQSFSFVDCTSFAIMERLGFDEAFAFDAHFLVYRFGPGRRHAFRRLPS